MQTNLLIQMPSGKFAAYTIQAAPSLLAYALGATGYCYAALFNKQGKLIHICAPFGQLSLIYSRIFPNLPKCPTIIAYPHGLNTSALLFTAILQRIGTPAYTRHSIKN